MPIIVAILFGIGILAIADTSKLPWFLQIIRAGLIIALRWGLKLGVVVLAACFCVWVYDSYTARKKAEVERQQWIADSLATTIEPIPEFDTPEYRNWRMYNMDEATEIEAKREAEASQAEANSNNRIALAAVEEQKKIVSVLIGSWGRVDTKIGSKEDLGVYTFKGNKSFYTNSQDYQAEKGTYKIDYNRNILYLFYDSGQSESISISNFTNDEIKGTHEQDEYIKVAFLKRPQIVPEEVSEPVAEQVQTQAQDPLIREYPDHSKDNQPTIAKPLRQH